MFTGPVGPVEVFFYWPKAVLGIFYWPGAKGTASSPEHVSPFFHIEIGLKIHVLFLINKFIMG